MTTAFWKDIATKYDLMIDKCVKLSGGDTSHVFLLKTHRGNFVLKLNKASKGAMFQMEALGLKALAKPEIIGVPVVFDTGEMGNCAYIFMEYIASGHKHAHTFQDFGEKLAMLHQVSSENFGFECDNFIGLLPQSNQQYTFWCEFYWYERIQP